MPKSSNPGGSRKRPYKNLRTAPKNVKKDARRAGTKAIKTKGMAIGAGASILTGIGMPVVAGVGGYKYGKAARKSWNKAGYATGGQIRHERRVANRAAKRKAKGKGGHGRQRRDRNGKFA